MSLTTVYQTTDGATHTSRRDANKHQAQLDTVVALTDLVHANVDGHTIEQSQAVAQFIVNAAPALMQALRQLKPQPLQDVAVLSELGLVSPSTPDVETAEVTEGGDEDEGNTPDAAAEVTETAAEAVEAPAEAAEATAEAVDMTAEVTEPVTFASPPPAAEQAAPAAEEARPAGSFF